VSVAATARAGAATLVVALAVYAALAPAARAADAGITRAQADSMLSELKAIRQLLERQQSARPAGIPAQQERTVTLPPTTAFELGRKDAPLTLVEFSDVQCPYCRQFEVAAFQQLKTEWIDKGRLRFVSRDLPLSFHPHSLPAANAARCAGDQGKYWEMRRVMIVNDDRLDSLALRVYASDLQLDTTRFAACLAARPHAAAIDKDAADAQAAGITGTPTFVLGRTVKQGFEGTVIVGSMPYADLDARLRKLLDAK
jgi:protein-disulfide isomerase